jgi:hypothetical protein
MNSELEELSARSTLLFRREEVRGQKSWMPFIRANSRKFCFALPDCLANG